MSDRQQIKLYSQDYNELLLITNKQEIAHQFLRDSGHSWLPMVIDFGNGWKQRWGGRLVLDDKGCISTLGGSDLLNYIMTWPTEARP